MFTIRKGQITVFEKNAYTCFEDDMVEHLRSFAGKHCEVIGEKKVRETIQSGIERAKKYDLTNRGPVRFFIEMMFMFGSEFDTDPQYPWAVDILNDDTIPGQMFRAERLYDEMILYLDNVAGPKNAYSIKALQGIRERILRPVALSRDTFVNDMLMEMKRIYPQKCLYTGDAPLRELIREGMRSAEIYAIQNMRGTMLFVVLMFALGHGFSDDPLFPWISKTLNDPSIPDPDQKAERVERKAATYLDNVLAYHAQHR